MINPKTGQEYPANPLRTWAVTKETFSQYYSEGRIVFPDDYPFLNITRPAFRYWKDEDEKNAGQYFGLMPASTKLPDNIGMSLDGTKEIICSGIYKPFQKTGSVNVQQNAEQHMETHVYINLEQTVEDVNELPNEVLPPEEKEQLNGKLASLSAAKGKNKATRWEIARGIIKWLADKSVEVGIAALPYIVEAIK